MGWEENNSMGKSHTHPIKAVAGAKISDELRGLPEDTGFPLLDTTGLIWLGPDMVRRC